MDSENVKDDSKDDKQVTNEMEKSTVAESEEADSESKDKENASSSSEQIMSKRGKSKGKLNGDSGISIEKSDESSSDEDSSKRQKMSESQPDTEVAECSGSKCDFSFRKLKSGVRKRYYRNKNSSEADEEVGETSGTRKSNADDKDKTTGDSDDSTLDSDDAKEQDGNTGTSRISPERSSSPLLNNKGADDSNEWTTASEEEFNIASSVLQKEKPKSKCFVVQELCKRQIGSNPEFSDRFYGSLQAVQRLKLKCKLKEHQGCVNCLNFNQKGNLLASTSDDLTVNIWDWATEKKQFTFQTGHKSNVFQAKWMPFDSESLMVTTAHDGQVRLLELPVGRSRRIGSHQGPVHKVAIHKETPHVILSCGEDGKILSIDIRESKPYRLMVVEEEMHEVQLYSIDSHPLNCNEFCVGGRIQTVQVFDRRKVSAPLYKYCPSHLTQSKIAHVTCALYNYNGTEILASYNDEDIYLFDTLYPHPSGDFAHRYQGHRNNATVKGVNFFGPKSEYIVSGSDCGNIFIWDKDTESIVQWLLGDEQGVVNFLETHPFIPVLATSGLDYDVKVWVPSSEELPAMKNLPGCVKLNLKNRAEELEDEPDAYDGQMLWILLRRIRQSERLMNISNAFRRRRRPAHRGEDEDLRESSSDRNSSNNSDNTSDDDDEVARPQCSPS